MQDLLLDTDLDIKTAAGDFVTGESTGQHQQLLLEVEKGGFKEFPDACIGIFKFLESEDPGELLRQVRLQFTGDGMTIDKMITSNGQLQRIEAAYAPVP